MSVAGGEAEALSYVDGCLAEAERLEFERRMSGDPMIAAQVESWRAQNAAIRAAYGERDYRSEVLPTWMPDRVKPTRLNREAERKSRPAPADRDGARAAPGTNARVAAKANVSPRRRLWPRWLFALAGGALISAASADIAPGARPERLLSSAFAAFRIFSGDQVRSVELATSDAGALQRWLRPQLGRAMPVPDFTATGFSLVGGRIVPGGQGAAAFALYSNAAHERIGVAIEASDSPAAQAFDVETSDELSGVYLPRPGLGGMVIVGRIDKAELGELARLAEWRDP